MKILLSKKINYKGIDLIYYETNKGTLFSISKLFQLRYPHSIYNGIDRIKFKISSHFTVPLLFWKVKVYCVGLSGVQQLFADKPDPELEKLLISLNIVQGDMPYPDDIRIIVHYHDDCGYDYSKMFNPFCADKITWNIVKQKLTASQLKVRVAYGFVKNTVPICYVNFNDIDNFVRKKYNYKIAPTKIFEVHNLIEIPDDSAENFYDRLYVSYCTIDCSNFKCFKIFATKANFLYSIIWNNVDIKEINNSITVKQKQQDNLQKQIQCLERENQNLKRELQIQKRLCYNL